MADAAEVGLIRLFGPFRLGEDGPSPGGPKQTGVLAQLALARGRVLGEEALAEGIWGEDPPARAGATIQVNVSNLRKVLAPTDLAIERVGPGYRLVGGRTDVVEIEARRREGGAAALEGAVALLAGPALDGLRDLPFASAAAAALDDLALQVREEHLQALLDEGRHAEAVGPAEDLLSAQPLREGAWASLLLALYRAGRQADALNAYQRARAVLADELGIDPGPRLRELETLILRQDASLDAPVREVPVATVPAVATEPAVQPLPLPPTELVGRREELEALRARVLDPGTRVLTLTGPGGVGKTRLATAVARLVADRFDLAAWVPLVDVTDAADVPDRVADALGLEGAADLALALHERRTLLVLDNLEQVGEAGVPVAALVAQHATVTVLATSRLPLRVTAEQVQPLAPLPLDDADVGRSGGLSTAARLFEARARAGDPGFSVTEAARADVERLCARLDGLPFALELAAARVRLLSPGDILARLDDRPASALGRGGADTPERHRTVADAIGWSLDLLEPEAAALHERLLVFASGFSVDAAGEVCGDGDVLEELTALLDANLLHTEQTAGELRLRQYALVRDHLRGRVEVGEDLRERHARWYAARARDLAGRFGGPESLDVGARFAEDAEEYRQALDWCSRRDPDAAVALVTDLAGHWVASGSMLEGLAVLDDLAVPDALAARLDAVRGQLHYYLTDWQRVRDLLEPLAGEDQPDDVRVRSTTYAAGALAVTGEPERARPLAEAGLALARLRGDRVLESVAQAILAICAAVLGDLATEAERHRARLALAREHGDRARVVDVLNTLAEIALDEDQPDEARERLAEALTLSTDQMLPERRDLLISLARVALVDEDPVAARGHLAAAWPLVLRLGQSLAMAQLLRTLAGICLAGGRTVVGARLLGGAAARQPDIALATDQVERDLAAHVAGLSAALGDAFEGEVETGRHLHDHDLRALVEVELDGLSDPPSGS